MLALDLIAQVSKEMGDPGFDWWLQSDWADYIDDAGKLIATLKPDAYRIRETYKLRAGPLQSLPDGSSDYKNPGGETLAAAVQLFSFPNNMGTDGLTIGAPIDIIERGAMDALKPDWASETASTTVQCAVIDDESPIEFSVYPPQPESSQGWISAIYGAIPPALPRSGGVPTADATIFLRDEFLNHIVEYMKFRAYTKDVEVGALPSLATSHFSTFLTMLGRKDLVEQKEFYKTAIQGTS